jgi:hypothetical protein
VTRLLPGGPSADDSRANTRRRCRSSSPMPTPISRCGIRSTLGSPLPPQTSQRSAGPRCRCGWARPMLSGGSTATGQWSRLHRRVCAAPMWSVRSVRGRPGGCRFSLCMQIQARGAHHACTALPGPAGPCPRCLQRRAPWGGRVEEVHSQAFRLVRRGAELARVPHSAPPFCKATGLCTQGNQPFEAGWT